MTAHLPPASSALPSDALDPAAIASGAYMASFAGLPPDLVWDLPRIERSLAETMAARPMHAEIWVFAYGSLVWNPMFDCLERRPALLRGWRRAFALRMLASRGSPAAPGRMLALVPGRSTRGVALRLDPARAPAALRTMWIREMITGAYLPTWSEVALDDGRRVPALVFAADPRWPLYERDCAVDVVAPLVATASGPYGSNADYLFRLANELRALGIVDAHVADLEAAVRRRIGDAAPRP
jgi:glutathione-specific gamma-glutamylcyclotransferase